MKSKTNKTSYRQSNNSTQTDSKRIIVNQLLKGVVDKFQKTASANLSEKKIITNAKIVIIAAYMRTGSTFMGGMFHHYPGTFYVFEPIRRISEATRDSKELVYVSGIKR